MKLLDGQRMFWESEEIIRCFDRDLELKQIFQTLSIVLESFRRKYNIITHLADGQQYFHILEIAKKKSSGPREKLFGTT